ncbi:MAG: efflux RND transporter periplasmic adaptor subunit [Phycisphaerales bacterium]|jgi:RND family efflux transporter MFP subunit
MATATPKTRPSRLFLALTIPLLAAAMPLAHAGQAGDRQDERPRGYAFEPSWAAEFGGIYHFTQPSKDAMMGFSQPSEVRSVLVSVGDRVEKGDVLVRARDGDIQAAYRLQQRRAKNRFEILAAENRVQLAQIEFDNQQTAQDQGGGSTLEYERARASLENAKIELDTANERFIEQGIILERQEADLERFAITAQFDGMVAAIEVTPGQAMQDSEPVLRLVSIDPLQVKVPTPTSTVLAEQLERGDKAWVAVSVAGEPRMFEGTVTEVSPVADFGSDKVWVKVEMPNPDRLLSGLPAWVRFSEPTEGFMRILAEHEAQRDEQAARDRLADDGEQQAEPALAADAG